jgi:hypothetical protein
MSFAVDVSKDASFAHVILSCSNHDVIDCLPVYAGSVDYYDEFWVENLRDENGKNGVKAVWEDMKKFYGFDGSRLWEYKITEEKAVEKCYGNLMKLKRLAITGIPLENDVRTNVLSCLHKETSWWSNCKWIPYWKSFIIGVHPDSRDFAQLMSVFLGETSSINKFDLSTKSSILESKIEEFIKNKKYFAYDPHKNVIVANPEWQICFQQLFNGCMGELEKSHDKSQWTLIEYEEKTYYIHPKEKKLWVKKPIELSEK